jgi:tetratricopeptide (TPR) repeat protein
VGGCTLEAAEAVCGVVGVLSVDVLEGFSALLEAGLLMRGVPEEAPEDGAGSELRLGMLETIREYALEQLTRSGEEAMLQHQHARYYLALAETAQPHLSGPEQGAWFTRLEQEHDNLRAALHWMRASGDTNPGLQLAVALRWYWRVRGHLSEGQAWLEEFLAADQSSSRGDSAPLRAQALHSLSVYAVTRNEYERARVLADESLALFRGAKDTAGTASALYLVGEVAQGQGEYEQAAAVYEEVLELAQTQGDTAGIANALVNLGEVARDLGRYERAGAMRGKPGAVPWLARHHRDRLRAAQPGACHVRARRPWAGGQPSG